MNIAHYISNWWKEVLEYKERVLKDGGTTKREDVVQQYNQMCKSNGIFDSIKFAWFGEAGGKLRTSGANQFWTKAYSLVTPQPVQTRRNLLTYTEEFDNSVWTKQDSTISSNIINNPFGVLSVDKLVESNTSASHYISYGTTAAKTFSIFVKAGERSWILLYSGISNSNAYFDLTNGVVGTLKSDVVSANIQSLQNGWYRINVTWNTTPNTIVIYLASANNSFSYQGDGTSGLYLWGAQLEVGSSPSSYQRVIDTSSWDGIITDATQTTSTSQPYLSGNIAPTERIGMKNPNGGSSYMTHPTISFADNEAWSVTTVVNWNGQPMGGSIIDNIQVSNGWIALLSSINKIRIWNSAGVRDFDFISASSLIGKTTILTFAYNGISTDLYVNGKYVSTVNNQGKFYFSNILYGYNVSKFNGSLSSHIIRAQALTPNQVAAEANFLRTLYPEIPSVTIGSQTWATSNCDMAATPQGNLIANVTENANVEKITNAADREFSSDTGWWTKGAGATISGGTCNVNTAASDNILYKIGLLNTSKYHKISVSITSYTSGALYLILGSSPQSSPLMTAVGTYTFYILSAASSGTLYLSASGATNLTIDNVSTQEVGWSESTNLYNYVYANTSGTVEQKTYAAVKAAAMWCYYNNDTAIGLVYGKLYNWYAVKLLQMDIDYYNAANPTTPWGWRVPADTDFNTLATTLGASVAGGKMKKDGLLYWSSPNTGADNSSGFSAIGGGTRTNGGDFIEIGITQGIHCINLSIPNSKWVTFKNNKSNFSVSISFVERGAFIRLIKS